MYPQPINTRQQIIDAAKQEFLKKGFSGATLRTIAQNAGVTTGAFYGYFASKEELFDAIVKQCSDFVLNSFKDAHLKFEKIETKDKILQFDILSEKHILELIKYIYKNFDSFKLILCCSHNTKYENFIHQLVDIEVTTNHNFINELQDKGIKINKIDKQLEHILISGFFSSLFEIIIHDMPQDIAIDFIHGLLDFYTAGWKKLMGI